MNVEQQTAKEIHLIDYIYVVVKWRTFILRVVLVTFAVTAVAYFFLIPRWYLAEATVTPAKQKNSFNASSLLKDALPFSGLGGVFRSSDELDLYLTILNSRNCLTRVINKFNLQGVYDTENIEETIKELIDNVEFVINDQENALTIGVFDTDPNQAAEMANYFIDVLNEVYIDMSISEAKNNLLFIQNRYLENLQRLKEAEDSLSLFQKKYGVFDPKEQIKAAIQAAATVQSQIMAKEVELGVIQKNLGSENQLVKDTKLEIAQLQQSLRTMEYGSESELKTFTVFPIFEKTPQLGKEYLRLFREVELQSKLQLVLLPMVEQARIEKQRNVPVVVVLDKAVPAEKPKKPRRIIMILLFTTLSFLLSTFTVFILDAFGRFRATVQSHADEKWRFVNTRLSLKKLFRLKGSAKEE